jgi:predicted aspartyl protease
MNRSSIFVDIVLNNTLTVAALIDEGCECYTVIDRNLVRTLGLPLVD